jgi:hypothetical protein
VGKGFGSFGLRMGAFALGTAIGIAVARALYSPPPREGLGGWLGGISDPLIIAAQGMLYGGSAGAVVAMAIDSAFVAHEDVRKPGSWVKPTAARSPSVSLVPSLGPTGDGFRAGVAGTF